MWAAFCVGKWSILPNLYFYFSSASCAAPSFVCVIFIDRYHSIAFLSMALAPMKALANRFVLDVFVIIERAINGNICCIIISEIFISRSIICIGNTFHEWGFQSLVAFFRLLLSSTTSVITTSGCMATLHCIVKLSPQTSHSVHLDWPLSRFYFYALHSVFSHIILLNIFADVVLKT